jgi:hypothetical protein
MYGLKQQISHPLLQFCTAQTFKVSREFEIPAKRPVFPQFIAQLIIGWKFSICTTLCCTVQKLYVWIQKLVIHPLFLSQEGNVLLNSILHISVSREKVLN